MVLDNSLLFCCASLDELITIHEILTLYKKALSQQINREKTTLFFSKFVSKWRRGEIINFLGEPEIKEYEKYFVLLAVVGRNKKANHNYIKDRVWNKL